MRAALFSYPPWLRFLSCMIRGSKPSSDCLRDMRVLFVNHTFPPHSYAGSELCVLNLAKQLQSRGHAARVFFRYSNPDDEELMIRKGEVEGISYSKINHTYRYVEKFQDIYLYPALAAKFGYLLRTFQPDIVHFHHLTNLSLSLVKEVKDYGCPAVMTLHDYWLLCQRGQLLKPDMSLCHGPSHTACRLCLGPQLLKGKTQRAMRRLWSSARKQLSESNTIRLMERTPDSIQTLNSVFYARTRFEWDGTSYPAIQAHPPTVFSYKLAGVQSFNLKTAYAMHPSTFDKEGGGVTFRIAVNGNAVFSESINPKKYEDQKGWHSVEIPVHVDDANECEIAFQTEAETPHDNQHCTAGWLDPAILLKDTTKGIPPKPNWRARVKPLALRAAGAIAAWSTQANEGIRHRRNWVRRVFDDVDLFISPSKFLREFFIRHGLPDDKIIFSDNGFLLPDVEMKNEVKFPLRFGYIGTWIPSKGVDLALKAFQDVQPGKARLIVYGFFPGYDGFEHYEDELKSLAGSAVEFKGKYGPDEVYEILQEMDCLIMPSIWWENSPMTIHEAFASRVPVITADVGGMAEQISEGGGMTFEHRNPRSLQTVIHKIIENPSLLSDMQTSIPTVKSIESFAGEIVDLYQDLISNYDTSMPIRRL